MTTAESRPTPEQPKPRKPSPLLGVLFLIPAVLACGLSQLALSISTLNTSLQRADIFSASQFIGGQNYAQLLQDKNLLGALGFNVILLIAQVLAVFLVPLLLAWGASRFGRSLRIGLKVLFTIPVAVFSPVALSILWALVFSPASIGTGPSVLATPASARSIFVVLEFIYTLGLACGVGLVFALAAFRDPQAGSIKPLFVTWGIGLLAVAALSLQSFTFSFVLTSGGPASATTTLVYYLYSVSFKYMRLGMGAAVSTILLALLGLLGLAAGALLVFTGLKIALLPRSAESGQNRQEGFVGCLRIGALILGLLAGLTALLLDLSPLFATITTAGLGQGVREVQRSAPLGSTLVNSLLPPLISVLLIQFPASYLGALGIGALRPLGRHSELLLLPFSPWLFTGLVPFSIAILQVYRQLGWLGKLTGLIQPLMISVPMLVLLTLFFKGQEKAFRDEWALGTPGVRAFIVKYVLPSLPLAGLLVIAGLFVSMQDSFWALVFANTKELFSANSLLLSIRGMYAGSQAMLASAAFLVLIPTFLFALLAFSIFQIFYLDRLTLQAGRQVE